ncbi:uncharacterized protein LOC113324260 [Papaver somniferum]|uniref:uncharacterized protein LOC113324260 n=1 Tax=Papaver somniferum TaxID=3469 RepID=UPI000E6FBF95|nr:uncharacterized protein LOC113324260 [Papaver somniferum]
MEAVHKKGPWNVCKSHLNLIIYDDFIPLKDWQFTHQDWTVQFNNLLLEHHLVQVVDETLMELECWTVGHDKEECPNIEIDLNIRIYTNEEYINYCHELARAYGVEIYEDLDLLLQRVCEASRKQIAEENDGQDDTRTPKRLRNSEDEFIELSGDIRLLGNPFTWTSNRHGTGHVKSRLDRALVNSDGFLRCPDSTLNHLHQNGSDHAPILLELSKQNTLPCSNAFIISNKLANMRYILYLWSKNAFGNITKRITQLQSEITTLQAADLGGSNTDDVVTLEAEIRMLNEIQSNSNKQKSRDHFYNDMDMNSNDSLTALLKNHFQVIMSTSSSSNNQHFLKHIPQCISAEDNQELEAIPTDQEIYQALMTMEPWTSSGPDGFPPRFYQTQWQLVKEDVCKIIKSFFHTGFLLKQLNNTRVSLIPKVQVANKPEDFRPIAL